MNTFQTSPVLKPDDLISTHFPARMIITRAKDSRDELFDHDLRFLGYFPTRLIFFNEKFSPNDKVGDILVDEIRPVIV